MKKVLLGVSVFIATSIVHANVDTRPRLTTQEAQQLMKKSMSLLQGDLRPVIGRLSDKTKGTLVQIYRHHDRHSQQVTLRQVMQEVGQEFETMVSGIFMNNPEMTADAAHRLANHRIPRGGLISYLRLEDLTDEMLSGLDAMNSLVEGNTIKLAQAAEKGDMTTAASYLTPIVQGCVSCHETFRGKPGTTPYIKQ